MEVPGIPVLVEGFLTSVGCADWLSSLILDGIVAGVAPCWDLFPDAGAVHLPGIPGGLRIHGQGCVYHG